MHTAPVATKSKVIGGKIPTRLIPCHAANGVAKDLNQLRKENNHEKTRTIRQHQCKEEVWHQPPEIQIHYRSQGLQEDEGQKGRVQGKVSQNPERYQNNLIK
jgi:hypothetical protein